VLISSRVHTNAIIEKIEEDAEWVKIGDKDIDQTKNDGEKPKSGRSNANKDPMGPFDTKS